jgi:ankyrin repeat protein
MLTVNPLAILLLAIASLPAASGQSVWTALRNGDTATLKQLMHSGADPNMRDDIGATPLMYAAAYGSLTDMSVLLDHGARVNGATKLGSTAMMWAAGDTAKLDILLKGGADANSKTKAGFSVLAAAAIRGNHNGVRLLIEHGANLKDAAFLGIAYGTHPACGTVSTCNADALRRISKAAGLEKEATSTGPMRPSAALFHDGSLAEPFAAGFPPNQVDAFAIFARVPALGLAAYYAQAENTRILLERGANPNQPATRNITPLMMAAASARPNEEIVHLLIENGADVAARDTDGRTALDWALTQGETEAARVLRAAGAKAASPETKAQPRLAKARDARTAIELAISRLQPISLESSRQVTCTSCHNQSLPAIAVKAAADQGIAIDPILVAHPRTAILAEWSGHRDDFLVGRCTLGGFPGNIGYGLLAMAKEGTPANATTDAAASCLASLQHQNGSWENRDTRPPLFDNSSIDYTALAIRGLSAYTPPAMRMETKARLHRALAFLRSAAPVTTQEEAFKLMGLIWSGVPTAEATAQAKRLLRLQQPDGGWGQLPTMASDAYATGHALYALHAAGIPATDPTYRKAATYLLSTQLEDGTWHVRSRAIAIQPYYESGFPHGKDQFISAAATSWAVIGLAYSL